MSCSLVLDDEQPMSKRDKATASAVVAVILTLPMLFSTPLRSERYKRTVKCAGEKKVSGVGFRHGMDYQRSGTHGDSLLC